MSERARIVSQCALVSTTARHDRRVFQPRYHCIWACWITTQSVLPIREGPSSLGKRPKTFVKAQGLVRKREYRVGKNLLEPEDLIKGLLPVASCHWWGTGVLEVLSIVGWRLLIFRVGVALVSIVCCLRRVLHGRRGCILSTALAARPLVVERVGFSTSTLLRHLGIIFKARSCKVGYSCIS